MLLEALTGCRLNITSLVHIREILCCKICIVLIRVSFSDRYAQAMFSGHVHFLHCRNYVKFKDKKMMKTDSISSTKTSFMDTL